jgi:ABC-type antimicrobial peptide transport system permease subunit
MRTGTIALTGVTGDLNEVLYGDMLIMTAGGPAALATILEDPQAVVISQGLAEALAIPLGGILKIQGEGLDHEVEARVTGIAQRVPGFGNIGRIRATSQYGSTVFMSLEGFRRLATDPLNALPPDDDPALVRIMATTALGADGQSVADELRSRFGLKHNVWMRLTEVQLQQAREERLQVQALLLVLTLISFTTAVFGVFAVNYATIYSRRLEIGMMKAVGSRSWELTGMFIVEAIAMTLSAAVAGILAGATMAYLFAYADNLTSQRPMQFAVDTTVMPFIVFMVVLASVLGATLSARRIVKQRAVEILRMS